METKNDNKNIAPADLENNNQSIWHGGWGFLIVVIGFGLVIAAVYLIYKQLY